MDIKETGNRIKHARKLRNYTLEDLASNIGVAISTVQRYENGLIMNPKLPVLQSIANTLKVNVSWLLGKDASMVIPNKKEGHIEWKWCRALKKRINSEVDWSKERYAWYAGQCSLAFEAELITEEQWQDLDRLLKKRQ